MCELFTKQGAMCDGEEGEADQSQLEGSKVKLSELSSRSHLSLHVGD